MILGIDPGLDGAMSWIGGEPPIIHPMPTLSYEHASKKRKNGKPAIKRSLNLEEIRDILEVMKSKTEHAYIEKAISMPEHGAVGSMQIGDGYGALRMALTYARIPYTEVHPATWKAKMLRGMGKGKKASILRAKQCFPEITLKNSEDGKAEAMLIAEYGRRILHYQEKFENEQ